MKKLVFLGGTCDNNDWRAGLIGRLVARGVKPETLFNPVVPSWNAEVQAREDQVKTEATFFLYYLGDPLRDDKRTTYYSLLEGTMGLYDDPDRTVVVFDITGMPRHAARSSLKAYGDLKKRFPNGNIFDSLAQAEDLLAAHLL